MQHIARTARERRIDFYAPNICTYRLPERQSNVTLLIGFTNLFGLRQKRNRLR